MHRSIKSSLLLIGLFGLLCGPATATVQILSMTPSVASPQPIGMPITWTVTATDSDPGPLTFQFNTALAKGSFVLAQDFNVGTLNSGIWTSQPFVWTPTVVEGNYQIRVVIKDFASGKTALKTVVFQVTPLASGGTAVASPTANPLVALFSAPSCQSGSFMRVVFHPQGSSASTSTNWVDCHPPATMNFEIAGMYPSTTYRMFSQTGTGTQVVNGQTLSFTTGPLPQGVAFPAFTINVPAGAGTDTTDGTILHSLLTGANNVFLPVGTDLSGNINWYYMTNDLTHGNLLARPLKGGHFLSIQAGTAWNPAAQGQQFLREIDLAGNIVHETNTGVIQQELLALGATDGGPCNVIPSPAPVGSACLGAFSHDAIRLPNGNTAVIADIEKIFPPGTQNNTSGLPVDVVGDMIVVLNPNWQVVWFWEAFQHDGGATQLDINRPAVLGETCINGGPGCPPILLLGSGIATPANDWLHGNSLYYWPQNGDIVYSSRNQDWVLKIDYNNGTGTGNVLWRMGLDGDFTFNNIDNDSYPWFSGQHDAGIENNGAGPLTVFDDGNTRVSSPPLGLGNPGCEPSDCNSRGMALTVDESTMQVTPVLSVDLGVFASALGSAQLLSDGNYLFQPGLPNSYDIEILPTPGTLTGTQVLNVEGPISYRSWQFPSFYDPPIT